ncbi:Nuclease-related domain [Lysinibacillus sphaericus]|nr:Nuclease-related domain [Lysinibacillus sphaericus]
MLYKQRTMPKLLQGLLALEKRLSPTHPQYDYIQKELYKTRAGYGGEMEYDRYMKEVRTDYPHAILHDLSLQQEGVYFQIDSLFITPEAIIITEIKNRAGKILIKTNPTQFLQVSAEGDSTVFRSPIVEVNRKQQFLERWLAEHNIHIPVRGIIVFAHNNELLIEEQPPMPVFTSYEAPVYFRSLEIHERLLDKRMIEKVATALVQSDRKYNPPLLSTRYRFSRHDVIPGVFCPRCTGTEVMQWDKLRWNCPNCGNVSATEHEKALGEWFLIVSGDITNRAFCEFTGIPDRHTAKRLLARSRLHRRGKRAGSVYVPANK